MLDTSDRLSLLALIVAIVALIVSAWQLAQQLFATATDGKRFCQGSVMGIWARKTRLSWRWSQIRFETKYTTPEIRMTSGVRDDAATSGGCNSRPRHTRLVYRLPLLGWLARVFNGPPEDWHGYFEITSDRPDLPLEMRKTVRPKTDPNPVSKAEKVSWWIVRTWDRSYGEDSPDIVSWPIFLQWIYASQVNAIRKIDAPESNGVADVKDPSNHLDVQQSNAEYQKLSDEPAYRDLLPEERELGEDRVVVRLVERSWDLIPPDVVRWVLYKTSLRDLLHLSLFRPLAKSTVGTMIVITHRLGMSWLGEFNPSEGRMSAAGSGHTLTSETVRGLGLVLQYTHHAESISLTNLAGSTRGLREAEYLSPTSTADKLHCGCLPIDIASVPVHHRVREECIRLIDVRRMFDVESILNRLGIPKKELDVLKDSENQNKKFGSLGRQLKHTIEDAVAMLCPIPTLPDCSPDARWIVWPYRTYRHPYTPFRQKEGVQELRDQLSKYMDENKRGSDVMRSRTGTHLRHLSKSPLEYLEFLLTAYPALRQNRNAPKNITAALQARNIFQQVHEIHHETSRVFAELSSSTTTDDEPGSLFLIDMAAAQVTLAAKHGHEADRIAMDEGTTQGLSDGDTRPRFVQELARLYAEDLHNDDGRTIRRHLRRCGYIDKLQPGEVPALWWTAVVRMVCWFISVRIRLPET